MLKCAYHVFYLFSITFYIISIYNQPTGTHIDVCEALAIPLHIMFPQPWYYGTYSMPHPFSGLSYDELSAAAVRSRIAGIIKIPAYANVVVGTKRTSDVANINTITTTNVLLLKLLVLTTNHVKKLLLMDVIILQIVLLHPNLLCHHHPNQRSIHLVHKSIHLMTMRIVVAVPDVLG